MYRARSVRRSAAAVSKDTSHHSFDVFESLPHSIHERRDGRRAEPYAGNQSAFGLAGRVGFARLGLRAGRVSATREILGPIGCIDDRRIAPAANDVERAVFPHRDHVAEGSIEALAPFRIGLGDRRNAERSVWAEWIGSRRVIARKLQVTPEQQIQRLELAGLHEGSDQLQRTRETIARLAHEIVTDLERERLVSVAASHPADHIERAGGAAAFSAAFARLVDALVDTVDDALKVRVESLVAPLFRNSEQGPNFVERSPHDAARFGRFLGQIQKDRPGAAKGRPVVAESGQPDSALGAPDPIFRATEAETT